MPLRVAPIDGLLILLTLIWGSNFSVVKTALEEIPPLPFNALRMSLATALFLALVAKTAPDSLPARRDWPGLVGLGLVGHFLYQVCFMEGIARTSVANSSLILGATPVVVALLNVVSRRDVPSGWHWLGIGLSLLGVYLVVGQGARVGTTSLTGDLLMIGAACCWAAYTVGARSMLDRHSALVVTAWTMAVGTALFVPLGLPGLVALEWRVVSLGAWFGLVYSAVFALCVAYVIWYTAVQRIGSGRTSVYANMVPVAAMVVAVVWLREPVGQVQLGGAASILAGVALTKLAARGERPASA